MVSPLTRIHDLTGAYRASKQKGWNYKMDEKRTPREMATSIHESIAGAVDELIRQGAINEGFRDVILMSDLYEENIYDYLVYRTCMNAPSIGGEYVPNWFTAKSIHESLSGAMSIADIEESIARMTGKMIGANVGGKDFVFPILAVNLMADTADGMVFYVTGHGLMTGALAAMMIDVIGREVAE